LSGADRLRKIFAESEMLLRSLTALFSLTRSNSASITI